MMTEAQGVAEPWACVSRSRWSSASPARSRGRAQDLDAAGRRTCRALELEALVGSVVELGRITGQPTPTIEAVYAATSLLGRSLAAQQGRLRIEPA